MQIAYREIYPGIEVFDCAALRATLGRAACVANYKSRHCVACWSCPIGAHHAGIKPDAPPRPKKACVRCGSKDNHRLIGDAICVSCYNRQTELLRGRNGKGAWPVIVARQLRWIHAIVKLQSLSQCERRGDPPNYAKSGLPEVAKIEPGVYFVAMVATGRAEFDAWLNRHQPTAEVIDYDQKPSFADNSGVPDGHRRRWPESRSLVVTTHLNAP